MKKLWLFLTLLLIPFSTTVNAQDVSYDMTQGVMEGYVTPEGHVDFEEVYTFDVDFMNGIYFMVDYGEASIRDYRVGVRDQDSDEIEYFTESFNGLPGTFRTQDDGQVMTFQVFNPASDEIVDIVFEYTIPNLITNYNDTAELNRKLVGENVDERFDFSGRIYLPGIVENPDDFRVWGYGSPNGEVSLGATENRSYIDVTVIDNPANQFVEVHSIFPTSMTPNNTNIVEEDRKAEIIESSNAQVEADRQANEARTRNILILIGVAVLAGPLVTIVAFLYYLRKRRQLNPQPANIPEHMYSLPEDITPAVMAVKVLRTEPNTDDFSATIIDLARKGYIQIREVEREKRGLFGNKSASTIEIAPAKNQPPMEELLRHEKAVYSYVIPFDEPATLADIEELIGENDKFRKDMHQHWTTFSFNATHTGEQLRLTPPERTVSMVLSVLALVVAVVVAIPTIIVISDSSFREYLPQLIGVFAVNLVVTIILLILNGARSIESYEDDKSKKKWQAFANMLDNIGNFRMRDIATLPLWEEYLAYAVSLNVADKVIDAMSKQYSADELVEHMHMPVTFYRNPYWINSVMRDSMSSSIKSSSPQQSYSGSNTGGFGGGFSGGSSGGSGGGGGIGGF